ncbi:response regulator [Methylobacterium sp. WL30]|nr:response regulator [Methylobacterium sp. WL93]TXN43465.1 response regulator [Methylobacterium sp. WL119]TXN61809.1 response regulator [Methylobacterium sp. WL30]
MTSPRSLPVLVVDDVPLIRAVVRATLEQVGLTEVHEAGDGAAALAMLNQRRYGLVIADWNMHPMTGYELLRQVRDDPHLRETPFVIMTTKEQAHCFVAARRAGVNACLIKPFMPAALRETIKQVWSGSGTPAAQVQEAATVLL